MDRRGHVLAPDHLAVGRIERQHLGIAGRHVEAAIPECRSAAKGVAALVLGLQVDPPDPVAARRIDGADLDAAIHREYPTAGDDRLRHNLGVARRAVANTGLPGARELPRQRRVAHRMGGIAARFRPVRVDRRRRQVDFGVGELRVRLDAAADPEHRDPLAGQRHFLVLEHIAPCRAKRQQQRGKIAAVHCETRAGYDLRAAAISAARARSACGAVRSSASCLIDLAGAAEIARL